MENTPQPLIRNEITPYTSKTHTMIPTSSESFSHKVSGDVDITIGLVSGVLIGYAISQISSRVKTTLEKKKNIPRTKKDVREEEERKIKELVKESIFEYILHDPSPVVIYKKNVPIFWNRAMEKLTGYTFAEIDMLSNSGVDIMNLFYGHSKTELAKVRSALSVALETKHGYSNLTCVMQTRDKQLKEVTWSNEILPDDINIRSGKVRVVQENEFVGTTNVSSGNISRNLEKLIVEKVDHSSEDYIKEVLFKNTLEEKNPIVIYEHGKVIFCNKAWEDVTEYTFLEIKELQESGVNLTELFYGYSARELARVNESIRLALLTGEGYEERIFTLKTKSGKLVKMAWHTEVLLGNINIRKGNVKLAHNLQTVIASRVINQHLIGELMRHKDEYTGGHIKRVMLLSVELARLYGYDQGKLDKIKLLAGLHDLGKTEVDEAILKKPGPLTKEELRNINAHAGNGVIQGIQAGYDDEYVRGMPHHSYFYGKWGHKDLVFEDLVEKLKRKEQVDPLLFNHLVGTNIPEEARVVAVADTIDAIISRRNYNLDRVRMPIENLINEVEKQLLEGTGLVAKDTNIFLDEKKWRIADEHEIYLPQCIDWNDGIYVPRIEDEEVKIQFDPNVVKALFHEGKLTESFKDILRENDIVIIPQKIIELEPYLVNFEKKFSEVPKDNMTKEEKQEREKDMFTYKNLIKAMEVLNRHMLDHPPIPEDYPGYAERKLIKL